MSAVNLRFLLVFLLVVGISNAALTTIIINAPSENEFIHGVYLLNATVGSGESADNASFWYSTNGIDWTLIGTNDTAGSEFTYSWDTSSLNLEGVTVKVNASNDTVTVSNTTTGITVDNVAPSFVSVNASNISEHNATIVFSCFDELSDNKTNASINYGTTTSLGTTVTNSSFLTQHNITITGLLENTTYYYNVTACDQAGNCNTTGPHNFTTLSISPLIVNVSSSVWSNYSNISFSTSEDTNASINYGNTTDLGTVVSNSSLASSHFFQLSPLENGTTYYYNITVCDQAGNCNTTGPYNFTTLVDTTPPTLGSFLVNGKTTVIVNQYDNVTFTAGVTDNINVSSVWVEIVNVDGTAVNLTMSYDGGNNYSAVFNATKSGLYNLTLYANDSYGNLAVWNSTAEPRNFSAYGYFSLSTNISSPFKNFTLGSSYSFLLNIFNNDDITENYTINVGIDNVSGWSVSVNQTNVTNVASLSSASVLVTVGVPSNASQSVTVYFNVTSSNTSHLEQGNVSFVPASISFSIPSLFRITDNENLTQYLFLFTNYNGSYVKQLKVVNVSGFSCEVDGNDSSLFNVSCGLYNSSSLVLSGYYNSSGGYCLFNISSLSGYYNFTVNVTDSRGHKGSAYRTVYLPSGLRLNASSWSSNTNLAYFTAYGYVYYDNTSYKVSLANSSFDNVKVSYSSYLCSGRTNSNGYFSFNCPTPPEGTYSVNVTVTGVWNITSIFNNSLTVSKQVQEQQEEKLSIEVNASSIELENQSVDVLVTVLNNFDESKTLSLTVEEASEFKHFDLEANTTQLIVPANGSETALIKVVPFKNPKPGEYSVKVTAGSVSTSFKVKIKEEVGEGVSVHKYVEVKKDNSSSVIGIIVTNNLNETVEVNVTEVIPKTIAENVSMISFSEEPTIIEEDPVVAWTLTLNASQSKTITYTVSKAVGNVSLAPAQVMIVSVLRKEEIELTEVKPSHRLLYAVIIAIITALVSGYLLFKEEMTLILERVNEKLPERLRFYRKKQKPKYPFEEKLQQMKKEEEKPKEKKGFEWPE